MNFKELNNLLIDARAGSRAAECHGFICGYLCVNKELHEDTFKRYLLTDTMDQDLQDLCFEKFTELAAKITREITDGQFELQLMLPDDSCTMSERGEALIQWCEGFLSGLGVAGINNLELLTMDSRELIQDLYKICRLNVDDMDESGEDEESAFMELTEYVRMGAILLHEELNKSQSDNSGLLH